MDSPPSWRPTASLDALRLRARLAGEIRAFFAARGVLEVETPFLSAATVTDPHLASPTARVGGETLYLQTSPELHMKRLLAAGSGAIYQLGRAFRDGEVGRRHNPELTLLEWYRPGFDHHRLMDEVEELVRGLLAPHVALGAGERLTYRDAFVRHAGVDPFTAPGEALVAAAAAALGGGALPDLPRPDADRDVWLELLLATAVEPHLGWEEAADGAPRRARPTLVYDFPPSQAALARIRPAGDDSPAVGERFELFVAGVELANGFHELADAGEQRSRFESDLAVRRERGLPLPPIDERFLAALAAGLPDCAGVALGFDRLVMLAAGATAISEVIAFPIDRA